jgi:hypothetical protein
VIVLVAGEGQAVALDRPGDEQGRHVVLRRGEGLVRLSMQWPPRSLIRAAEFVVVVLVEEGGSGLAEVRFDRARQAAPPW